MNFEILCFVGGATYYWRFEIVLKFPDVPSKFKNGIIQFLKELSLAKVHGVV